MKSHIAFLTACAFLLGWTSIDGVAQEPLTQSGLEVEVIETPGKLPPLPSPPQMGNPVRGAELYDSCVSCHGLNGKDIAGQTEGQLMASMQNYQTGTFTAPRVVKMQQILRGLSQEQLVDLAAYISKM